MHNGTVGKQYAFVTNSGRIEEKILDLLGLLEYHAGPARISWLPNCLTDSNLCLEDSIFQKRFKNKPSLKKNLTTHRSVPEI